MKHVFMMHSAITYLASLSVISAEDLNVEECLFLYQGKDLGFPKLINSVFLAEEKINQWGYVNKIDKLISRYTKEDSFHVYLASINALSRILISHVKCASFSFIEEGTASYFSSYNMGLFYREYPCSTNRIYNLRSFIREAKLYLRALLNLYSIKYFRLPLDYSNYAFVNEITFYCTNPFTFPLALNRKIIPFVGRFKQALSAKYDLNDQYLWISSKLFDAYPNNCKELASVIRDYFTKLKSNENISKIFVKFHQYEKESSKELLLSIFDELGIEYIVMNDSVIMEIELLNAKDLTMIGDISSLMLYNTLCGNRSISLAKQYAERVVMNPSHYSEEVLNTLINVEFV